MPPTVQTGPLHRLFPDRPYVRFLGHKKGASSPSISCLGWPILLRFALAHKPFGRLQDLDGPLWPLRLLLRLLARPAYPDKPLPLLEGLPAIIAVVDPVIGHTRYLSPHANAAY